MLHDGPESGRRYGEVISRALRRTELATESLEGRGIVIVAADELQQPGKLFKGARIQASMFFQAILGPGLQSLQAPPFPGDANHRDVYRAALHHRLERWKDLFVRQVSGRSEEHQRVRMHRVLAHTLSEFVFSKCPPKPNRIAERSLSSYSASPRE